MLSSLQIENVAVIQKANVHFEKGLNVLTGETGAGKSILIDSINAILGNRTSKDLVRTGAAKAVIRAAFEDVPPAVLDSLEKAGYERSEALLLSREITAEGKSTCRINGMPATAAVLRELCGGPATGAFSGTPALSRDMVLPQTEAWEDDPLDSRISETTRIAYGNSSTDGITGSRALSARAP